MAEVHMREIDLTVLPNGDWEHELGAWNEMRRCRTYGDIPGLDKQASRDG